MEDQTVGEPFWSMTDGTKEAVHLPVYVERLETMEGGVFGVRATHLLWSRAQENSVLPQTLHSVAVLLTNEGFLTGPLRPM